MYGQAYPARSNNEQYSDYTDTERSIVQTVKERYGKPVDVQSADAEIRLYPDDRELTACRCCIGRAWRDFVIFKAGENYATSFLFIARAIGTGREGKTRSAIASSPRGCRRIMNLRACYKDISTNTHSVYSWFQNF